MATGGKITFSYPYPSLPGSKQNGASTSRSVNAGSHNSQAVQKQIGLPFKILVGSLLVCIVITVVVVPVVVSIKSITTTSTTVSTISTTVTTVPTYSITRAGDPIIGIYNTTAGGNVGGVNGSFSSSAEYPLSAVDNNTATKYLNYGVNTGGITVNQPGLNSGFYVIPVASNASIAVGLLFATANDVPDRDPITVTLEGTNATTTAALSLGSSWTLIYSGPTGINATADPGRLLYVPQQSFTNTQAFRSYRLLVTSQRGNTGAVQYSEAQIIGYL